MGLFGKGIIGNNNGSEVRASGGEITINGDYKTHTFKSGNGSFNINYIPTSLSAISASILVVGGGGAGGGGGISPYFTGAGGGGGAGGVVIVPMDSGSLPVGAWSIYVGEGGVGSVVFSGSSGENSTMISGSYTLTALGGAGGGTPNQTSLLPDGGSGGGGFGGIQVVTYPSTKAGSDGIQDTQSGDNGTYGFGNDAGDGYNSPSGTALGAGGGGASQASLDANVNFDGQAGNGITWSTSTYGGDDRTVGGGGGGGGSRTSPNENGGTGGGGRGYRSAGDPLLPTAGTPNTGGGGGGGNGAGANGGSGVVAIRYKYKNL